MSAPDGPDGVADVHPDGRVSDPAGDATKAADEPAQADTAAPERPGTARTVVAAVLAVVLLVAAVVLTRHGIVTDVWPAFLPDTDSTSITRYSGSWLSAAAAALLGAGLSLMLVVQGIRGRRARAVRSSSAVGSLGAQ